MITFYLFLSYYSVLRAITGSFLLATLDGIKPAITVKTILINTNIIAPTIGSDALTSIPLALFIIEFINTLSITVTPTPINPAVIPTINVSALNTLDISFY